ncbi:MAG: NAD-dependent epimerase/dehydratase family protein [Acidimicrobiia bacterium]
MKILITGASGYLGKRLLEALQHEKDLKIFVIGNNIPEVNTEFTFIRANLCDVVSLNNAAKTIGELDTIIHLAAKVPKTGQEDMMSEMVAVNIVGTINLLSSFKDRFKKLVFGSTAEIYGLPEAIDFIDERQMPQPKSYYGITKYASEILAKEFCSRNNISFVSLRFSVMYGSPDLIKRAIPNFINQAINNATIHVYGGEELRDYLHIDDAVNSILISTRGETQGTYNIGTGVGISILDTARKIVDITNSNSEIEVLPRQKPSSDIILNCDAAKSLLGFKANYIFPAGIEGQIKWQISQ